MTLEFGGRLDAYLHPRDGDWECFWCYKPCDEDGCVDPECVAERDR